MKTTEPFVKHNTPYPQIEYGTLNPLSPIALMDMPVEQRLKYGRISPFFCSINSVQFGKK